MKKLLTAALIGGLIAGSLVAPAAAAKKKKPKPKPLVPAELTYFLHWDDDGSGGCGGMKHMNLTDGEDPGHGCGPTQQPAQEVYIASGAQPKIEAAWTATAGTPFVLDATRKVTGEIVVQTDIAAPLAALEITLTGESGGELKELGTYTSDNFTLPSSFVTGQPQVVEFEIAPPGELQGLKFDSLTLTTAVRNVAVTFTYIGLDDPASFVKVPVLAPAA
ncbi:MAG: hypothetical protein M3271_03330 [Actinomycetota bacterium]|nr:hypothetical protein [Actinomycetota bacterium]